MAVASTRKSKKHIPGSDTGPEEIFDFPYLTDSESLEFIKSHGRIMLIIRGPPGTAKTSLSDLIRQHFESSVFCSADNYFSFHCVGKTRNKESLALSHKYCKERVTEECKANSHPIIVQNTHMKRFELQPYIDLANQYGYTIIMAITLRKFEINPKILAATNNKGLDEEYFRKRLLQWQECNPLHLGWFLNVDDSSYILNEGKKILSSLLADGKFCNIFNTFSDEDIWNFFKARKNLSCIATYCEKVNASKWEFYLSDMVQNSYGKCFPLTIYGYVISQSYFVALMNIPPDGKELVLKKTHTTNEEDSLCRGFSRMGIRDSVDPTQLTSFTDEFKFGNLTAIVEEWENFKLHINDLTVMILGQRNKYIDCKDVYKFLIDIFGDMVDDQGKINIGEYAELDDGTEYLRLHNNTWFVPAAQKVTVKAVFTGRYQ